MLKQYFIKGSKENKKRIRILVLSFVFIMYLSISYISTPQMCIDFPCFVEIKDSILKATDYPDTLKYSIVFVTIAPEHTSGGGCYVLSVDNNKTFEFGGKKVLIKDSVFSIDNITYGKEKDLEFYKTRLSYTRLWWIYTDKFILTNLGFAKGHINIIDKKEESYKEKVLILKGFELTSEKLNIITLILYFIITITLVANTIMWIYFRKTN